MKELLDAGDDEDEEHASHDIFCEMEELRAVGDDGDVEWKETARWVSRGRRGGRGEEREEGRS